MNILLTMSDLCDY